MQIYGIGHCKVLLLFNTVMWHLLVLSSTVINVNLLQILDEDHFIFHILWISDLFSMKLFLSIWCWFTFLYQYNYNISLLSY